MSCLVVFNVPQKKSFCLGNALNQVNTDSHADGTIWGSLAPRLLPFMGNVISSFLRLLGTWRVGMDEHK